MPFAERCASLYGPRPVQVFDSDFDDAEARERRAIIRQATSKADSLFQIQVIFHCGFVFGLLIAPFPVAVGTYLLMQMTELHALIVYRAVYKAAQDPKATLIHLKRPIRNLSYSLAVAGGVCLFLVYIATPESWSLGVLAGCGLAAAYFIPFAKQNGAILYTTLGIFHISIFSAALARPFFAEGFSVDAVAAPLALALFMMVTTIAIALNVRLEYFKRLDDEELIEHAFAELKMESRTKSVLLAQLSHEIRTPLTSILGGVELLRLKDLPDDQRHLVEAMRESGGNLVQLLDRILEISAAEVDAIAIRRAPGVLASIISEEIAQYESRAREAGVSLVLKDGICRQPRHMDHVRVRQCVANLIGNAIDHSGGDRITITGDSATDGSVAVTISDNGRGVPPDRRELIFHAFGDKGLDVPYDRRGAGLGLALSRSIARAMGGDLELIDSGGPGSTFKLRFAAPLV